MIDVLNTVNLLQGRGGTLRSPSDGIDLATGTGRLILNMLATLADYERELIAERVIAGIAAAKANVTRFGRPTVDPAVIAGNGRVCSRNGPRAVTAEEAANSLGGDGRPLYGITRP